MAKITANVISNKPKYGGKLINFFFFNLTE